MGHSEYDPGAKDLRPWNAGRKIGAKRALRPQQVWAIRFWLDRELRLRDRAMFDLAYRSCLATRRSKAPSAILVSMLRMLWPLPKPQKSKNSRSSPTFASGSSSTWPPSSPMRPWRSFHHEAKVPESGHWDFRQPSRINASAALTIGMPSNMPRARKSSSPDTIRSARAARAQASTASSSGSRQIGRGNGGAATTSTNTRSSSRMRFGVRLVRARMSANLGRAMTSRSSSISTALSARSTAPSRALPRSACGGPRQSNPDNRTLVSITSSTMPAGLPCCFHLGLDLGLRHGGRPRCGNFVHDSE